ncbi:MAG TPA: hypothetical protein VGJ33_00630 [Candidatus Angelobacter sp.]|jgi:hypothetical protein
MDSSNYRKRVLHKLAADIKLPKLTFQVIRCTIATLAQKGTVKDVQAVLRHCRAATTTDVYMQAIPMSVQGTVDSISSELRKRSKSARQREKADAKSNELTACKHGDEIVLTPNDTKAERRSV